MNQTAGRQSQSDDHQKPAPASAAAASEQQLSFLISRLDLPLDAMSALLSEYEKNARPQESELMGAVRHLPRSRELLAAAAVRPKSLAAELRNYPEELEVAGLQLALVLIHRRNKNLAIDSLNALSGESEPSEAIATRLKRVYLELFKGEAQVVGGILLDVRKERASEGNTAFLKGFLSPFTSLGKDSSPSAFSDVDLRAFSFSRPELERALAPTASQVNETLKLTLENVSGDYEQVCTVINDHLKQNSEISADDMLLILRKVKASKKVTLPGNELSFTGDELSLSNSAPVLKASSKPYLTGIDLIFRGLSALNPATLTKESHAEIFKQAFRAIAKLGGHSVSVRYLLTQIPTAILLAGSTAAGIFVPEVKDKWPALAAGTIVAGFFAATVLWQPSTGLLCNYWKDTKALKRDIKNTRLHLTSKCRELAAEKLPVR